jgi:hypothetical protein
VLSSLQKTTGSPAAVVFLQYSFSYTLAVSGLCGESCGTSFSTRRYFQDLGREIVAPDEMGEDGWHQWENAGPYAIISSR